MMDVEKVIANNSIYTLIVTFLPGFWIPPTSASERWHGASFFSRNSSASAHKNKNANTFWHAEK